MSVREATPRAGHPAAEGSSGLPVNVSAYPTRGILQVPVWTWEVPAYFFLGGVAAGSALLAFAADLTGNRPLRRRAKAAALGAIALSPPLLVSDLGRPERFYNMLRVFRPTSPMNVGTWVLSAFGAAAGAAGLAEVAPVPRGLGRAATGAAALLGLPLATYTGVLVAQTSVPAWHESRRRLPPLFAASALASAGGLLAAVTPVPEGRPAALLGLAGGLAEVGLATLMERELGAENAYGRGPAREYGRLARGASLAGAAALAVGRWSRWLRVAGGVALAVGGLSERFAVWKAGIESARRT